MGADLYIRSLFDANKNKWQSVFDDAVTLRDSVQNGNKHGVNLGALFAKVNDNLRAEFPKNVKLGKALAKLGEHIAFGKETPKAAGEHAQVIVSLAYEKIYEKGYYRDSYNSTNCLNRVGISWWQDVVPMLKDRELVPDKAKELRDRIAKAKIKLPTKAELVKNGARITPKGADSLQGWHKYFKKGVKELVSFLDEAIKLNEPIDCSL